MKAYAAVLEDKSGETLLQANPCNITASTFPYRHGIYRIAASLGNVRA